MLSELCFNTFLKEKTRLQNIRYIRGIPTNNNASDHVTNISACTEYNIICILKLYFSKAAHSFYFNLSVGRVNPKAQHPQTLPPRESGAV